MDQWPFLDPPNLAVISVRQILNGGEPIRVVSHDASDGGWQFLTGEVVDEADATVVSLMEMVKYDSTLVQLADLPLGWRAWRHAIRDPWQRAPTKEGI